MRKWSLLLLVLLPLGACEERESGQVGEAPVEAVPPDTGEYAAEEAIGPGAPNSQRITVQNPFTEPVEVTATYRGETKPLGTVLGHASGEFFIQEPAGTEVVLEARGLESGRAFQQRYRLGDEIRWQLSEDTPAARP